MATLLQDKVLRLIFESSSPYRKIQGVNEFIQNLKELLPEFSDIASLMGSISPTIATGRQSAEFSGPSFAHEESKEAEFVKAASLSPAPYSREYRDRIPSSAGSILSNGVGRENLTQDEDFAQRVVQLLLDHKHYMERKRKQDQEGEGWGAWVMRKATEKTVGTDIRNYIEELTKLVSLVASLAKVYRAKGLLDKPVESVQGRDIVNATLANYRAIKGIRSFEQNKSTAAKALSLRYNHEISSRKDGLCGEVESDAVRIESLSKLQAAFAAQAAKLPPEQAKFSLLRDKRYETQNLNSVNTIAALLCEFILDREREILKDSVHGYGSLTDNVKAALQDIKDIIAGKVPGILSPFIQREHGVELPYSSIFTMLVVRKTELRIATYFKHAKQKFKGALDLPLKFAEVIHQICVEPIDNVVERWNKQIATRNLTPDNIRYAALCKCIDNFEEDAGKQDLSGIAVDPQYSQFVSGFCVKIKEEIAGIFEEANTLGILDLEVGALNRNGMLRLHMAMMEYKLGHIFDRKFKIGAYDAAAGFAHSSQITQEKLQVIDDATELCRQVAGYLDPGTPDGDVRAFKNNLYNCLLYGLAYRELNIGGSTTIAGIPYMYEPEFRGIIRDGKKMMRKLIDGRLTQEALYRHEEVQRAAIMHATGQRTPILTPGRPHRDSLNARMPVPGPLDLSDEASANALEHKGAGLEDGGKPVEEMLDRQEKAADNSSPTAAPVLHSPSAVLAAQSLVESPVREGVLAQSSVDASPVKGPASALIDFSDDSESSSASPRSTSRSPAPSPSPR